MGNTKKAASVEFIGVSKKFGTVTAIDNITFKVEEGNLVTFLGPSGCGKTTMLRIIAGLEMVTSGSIHIDSKDVTKLPPTERDVSMVFQSYALFPHFNVLENVSYGLTVSGVKKTEAYAQAEDGLALVGLSGYGKRMPSELSGGQQQRVAVARALVLEPRVLLFDEPLSNLDAKLRKRVREEIREIQQNLGLTTVYVTHDQEEALAVSDKVVVMREASIAQVGSPQEIYESPVSHYVADFVGDANLLQVEISAIKDTMAVIKVGALTVELAHRGMAKGAANVAIRPESINLSTKQVKNGLEGTIRKATYLGSHMDYLVDTPVGELYVFDGNIGSPLIAGTSVSITLASHGVTLVGV